MFLTGILFGILACALWGLVYMVPLWLSAYDPMLIALARYVVFGLLSCVLLLFNGKYLKRMTRSDWVSAVALGVIGNLVFYWTLASAVQLAGAPIAGAFTAVIPIAVALVANTKARRLGGGVAWRALALPLSIVAAGMVCLNRTEFSYFLAHSSDASPLDFWIGVLFAFVSLILWTWYPISNAEWLLKHRATMSAMFWSAAQGVATLPAALVGIGCCLWRAPSPSALLGPSPADFLWGVLLLGVACSWLGICFWNAMSQRLTPALGGQMIIFETIFAVIYAHVLRGTMPTGLMSAGMLLLVAGVCLSVRVFQREQARMLESAAARRPEAF